MSKLETVAALSKSPEATAQSQLLKELATLRQELPEVARRVRELQALSEHIEDSQTQFYRKVEEAQKALDRHWEFVQVEAQQLEDLRRKPISEASKMLSRFDEAEHRLLSRLESVEQKAAAAEKTLQQAQTLQKSALWYACLGAACLLCAVAYTVFMK